MAETDPPAPNLPPAGWHPDPEMPQMQRYWDGAEWTEHRAPFQERPPGTPGFAVAGLVCGIIGFVFGLIALTYFLAFGLGFLALVFGLIGWRKTGGNGMAGSAVALGLIALAMGVWGYSTLNDAAEELDRSIDRLNRDLEDIGN